MMQVLLLAALTAYPPYPAAIERDGTYAVSVRQCESCERLVVYNHCEKSGLFSRTHGGDVNRRFCEFSFDGGSVTVDIAVREDVKAYKVFPASRKLRHVFDDGVIRVTLEKPTTFGIQLNDSDKTILSVFADAPEPAKAVPKKDDPSVMYVEGWVDAPGRDGVIQPPVAVKEVYLAPGSVLNARLVLCAPGTCLHGRGMILDPMSDVFRYDQTKNASRGLVRISGAGSRVEDVKLIDARTFNFCSFTKDVAYRNIKILSSMMCSDGITVGGCNVSVDGTWIYNGDNGIVVSGCRDSVFRNLTLGTSCAAIFPQGDNYNVRVVDADVFRADDGVINNRHNGPLRRKNKWGEMSTDLQKAETGPQASPHLEQQFFFERLSAVDCTLMPHLFQGRNMGCKPKSFAFHDLSVPAPTGESSWRAIGRKTGAALRVDNDPSKFLITDNYRFSVTNLVLDGRMADAFPSVKGTPEELRVTVVRDGRTARVPFAADRVEVNWTCPEARRQSPSAPMENLLADRPATRSIWQRTPSWLVKFEATQRDEKGAVLYHLVQCERNAGIQAILTERVRAAGFGKFRLTFEVRARSENAFGLVVSAQTNEELRKTPIADVPADGAWHAYDVIVDCEFDPKVTDVVGLGLFATKATDEIWFRNFCLSPFLSRADEAVTPDVYVWRCKKDQER